MKKVLVVDDEPDYRLILRSILTTQGYDVIMSGNGEEALQRLEETEVDCIVSDIYMPAMDGIKFHRTLRSMAKYQKMPFLFVSAFDDQLTLEAVKDPRYDGFLRKARPVEELMDWVEYLMTPEERRSKAPPSSSRSKLRADSVRQARHNAGSSTR